MRAGINRRDIVDVGKFDEREDDDQRDMMERGSNLLLAALVREHADLAPAKPIKTRPPRPKRPPVYSTASLVPVGVIVEAVSDEFNVPVVDIVGDSRFQHIMQARKAVYYIASVKAGHSYAAVGRAFCGMHHKTVSSGVASFAHCLGTSDDIRDMMERAWIAASERVAHKQPADAEHEAA